jgi:hypothetical protein
MPRIVLLPALLLVLLCGCPGDDPPVLSPIPAFVSAHTLKDGEAGIGGPLSQGLPGDVLMENGRIRVVLQQPGRALALNPYGGTILDADVVRGDGLDRDRFGEVGLFVNSAFAIAPESMEIVEDGSGGRAVVRFVGPPGRADYINAAVGMQQMMGLDYPIDTLTIPDLEMTVTYTLSPYDAFVRVDVELVNRGDESLPLAAGWLIHGGLAENYYPALGGYRTTQIASAGALLVAGDEVAYAFAPLPYEPGEHGLGFMAGGSVLIDSIQILDVLSWPDSATVVLAPGDSFAFDAAFVVDTDVSGVMRTLRGLGDEPAEVAKITGSVQVDGGETPVPHSRVVALARDDDQVLAATVADGDGAYVLQVPAGEVDLIAGKPGWPYDGDGDTPGRVAVDAGADVDQVLFLPPTGELAVTAMDGDGAPLPCRVVVLGLDPSPPNPALEATGTDPLPPGVTALLDLPVDGALTVDLEPGEYDVVVTRGMEYDAHVESVTVDAGGTATVDATLHRVLDTDGWLTGDFHIHAAAGPDLVMTDTMRVANFAADGVEVLVTSNHAYVADLTPEIEELALESWVTTIPSQEVTTFDYGHFGLFPMVPDPTMTNGGAFDWVGSSPTEIFDWALTQDREMVAQINHPRHIPTPATMQNFFSVLDLWYDEDGWYIGPEATDPPGSGLPPDPVMFGPGFTAMEVMTWLNVQGLSDWFNLLSAGYRFTATANSDSHTCNVEGSGWPRNFVYVGYDEPADLDVAGFVSAVNRGQLSGSFGPLVTLEAEPEAGGDAVMQGGTLLNDGQPVRVRVRIQTPTWAPVDTLTLYMDGEVAAIEPLTLAEMDGAGGGTRLEQTVEVVVDAPADTWVAAVVTGETSLFPYVPFHQTDPDEVTLQRLRDGEVDNPATPFGYANPVFIDADADGAITPTNHVMPADYDDYRQENRLDPY